MVNDLAKKCSKIQQTKIYFIGKNAEAIGEDGTFWAVVSWSPCAAALLRGQIRKKKGIEGKLWQDLLCYCCLPCCTAGQEALELESVNYLLEDEVQSLK